MYQSGVWANPARHVGGLLPFLCPTVYFLQCPPLIPPPLTSLSLTSALPFPHPTHSRFSSAPPLPSPLIPYDPRNSVWKNAISLNGCGSGETRPPNVILCAKPQKRPIYWCLTDIVTCSLVMHLKMVPTFGISGSSWGGSHGPLAP